MPVNAPTLADLALGAAKKPIWKAPPPTSFGPQITSQTQEGQYHPRVDVVQEMLSGLTQAQRQSVLSTRLTWLQQRKSTAEAALGAINVSQDLPSTLAHSTVSNKQWPLKSDGIRVRELWFRLLAGQKSSSQGEVYDTDQAVDALTDNTVIGGAAGQAASSAALLLQMRCLADIYARWEMAAKVTQALATVQLAVPPLSNQQLLARVLTYGRIEGDLSVPPEDDTLEGTDPGTDANQVPLPPGRSRFLPDLWPSAYLFCVTYLAQPKDFGPVPPNYFVPGFITEYDLSDSQTCAKVADCSFTMVMGGLDILWRKSFQIAAEQMLPDGPTSSFVPTDPFDWPALNRQSATVSQAAAKASAQADYRTRMGLLTARMKGPAQAQASRTSPEAWSAYAAGYANNPPYSGAGANYLGLVLSEGLRYMDRLTYGPTRFGAGAANHLPEILVYLLFHQQGNSSGMLASAAANALRKQVNSSDADYAQKLQTALNNAGLTAELEATLKNIRLANTTEDSVTLATQSWGDLGTLLGNPGVVGPLADYIRNATDAVWKSWAKPSQDVDPVTNKITKLPSPRSNCIGYMQLYEYLTDQIGGG